MRNKHFLLVLTLSLILILSLCLVSCGTPNNNPGNPDNITDQENIGDDTTNNNQDNIGDDTTDNNQDNIGDDTTDNNQDNIGDDTDVDNQKVELKPSEIYKKVNESVAFILINKLDGMGSGTGFFIDNKGTLITNYNVIKDGTYGEIKTKDGFRYTIGNVLGYDETKDIAILSTNAPNTTPVQLANSDDIVVGESIYAIGYPEAFTFDDLSSTFTIGMISTIRTANNQQYIQSTIDIVPGNSGGPLINQYGEVIGITTENIKFSDINYMNASLPINLVSTIERDVNESLLITTKRHYPVNVKFYIDDVLEKTLSITYESKIEKPTDIIRGKDIEWCTDIALTNKFDYNSTITEDLNLYGRVNYLDIKNGVIVDCAKDAKNIVIPSSYDEIPVTSIGDNAFSGCNKLTSVTLQNGLTSIGTGAFNACSNLTNVIIPNSVTNIGDKAFSGCNALTSLTIPFVPTHISDIFDGYNLETETNTIPSTLTEVIITGGTTIANRAFGGCTNLTSITIPNTITYIDQFAFLNCSGLTKVNITDLESWCKIEFGKFGANPLFYAHDLYLNNEKIINLQIPEGLTKIGNYAFLECTNLTSITIPNSVTTIGAHAFDSCIRITEMIVPNTVTSIGEYAFYYCKDLVNVQLSNSLTSIEPSTFSGCFKLESITIPKGVTRIGSDAFSDCEILKNVTIPNTVKEIGDYAFSCCSKLQTIKLPTGIKRIGNSAFYHCYDLIVMSVPDGVTSIGESAFCECTSLIYVILPTSLETIDYGAFYDCTSLEKVYYKGDYDKWKNINIHNGNNPFVNATTYFYSETEPSINAEHRYSGYYWRYNSEGFPQIWVK